MKITEVVPVGHENAVDRKELVRRTGMSDRKARVLIEEAWQQGYGIVNEGNGKGYYIVDENDPIDVRSLAIYLAKEEARKRSINDKLEIGYKILRSVITSD